jgi:hypothetical protein
VGQEAQIENPKKEKKIRLVAAESIAATYLKTAVYSFGIGH